MSRTAVFTSLVALSVCALGSPASAATLTFPFPLSSTELVPVAPTVGGNFGVSIDTDATTAIVGAKQGTASVGSGAATLYNATTGAPLYSLVPTGGVISGDRFGDSVAVDSAYAVVGANGAIAGAGSAYVFSTATGAQLFKLMATDGVSGDSFGDAVDLVGNLALVGAPQDDDLGMSSGSAYLFDVSTGVQTQKLLPDDGAAFSQFGYSVALDGTTALVGARLDDGVPLGTGAAYLFNTDTGSQLLKVTPSDPATGDRFGEAVALDGGVAVVGASRGGGGPGAAYVFDATTGAELYKFTPSDGALGFNFGVSVAVGDGFAFIGASGAKVDGITTGAVYAFDLASGVEVAKLAYLFGASGDNLGVSVAYENGVAAFGSSLESFYALRSGAAYLLPIDVANLPEPTSVLFVITALGVVAVRRR